MTAVLISSAGLAISSVHLCLEPIPSNVAVLKKNLEQFDPERYDIIQQVVSVQSGSVMMVDRGWRSKISDRGDIEVQVSDFQALLTEHRPTMIKMDIEGAESEKELQSLPCHRSLVVGTIVRA